MTLTPETIAELRVLLEKATPGPYRAHDHESMRIIGEDPEQWIGYAWVGRSTKNSTPDGRWDAGWLDLDRPKDACKEYRERASADAHYVAAALNAFGPLLDDIERYRKALEPFADIADLIGAETAGLSSEDELHLMFHDYLMERFTVHQFYEARQALGGEHDR